MVQETEKKIYHYWLPDQEGNKKELTTDKNAIIIVGANGAGKSKLGAWIEQQNFEKVHRIGAQRDLNFQKNLQLRNFSEAEDLVQYGTIDENAKKQKLVLWNWGKSYTTKLIQDFDNVLAALLALNSNKNQEFITACQKADAEGKQYPPVPLFPIDILRNIWNAILPQRKLKIEDSKFFAVLEQGEDYIYSATEMSDGERAVLYLISQVLCVPQNKILIIDEPEIHLHRSLMNRLWELLEENRKDCLFIYITHDTQFAALHQHASKIWVKSFDGKNWQLEEIHQELLPEDLLFEILGSRKNVLFVEGQKNSYDIQIYSLFYPDFYVIPCGSCRQVIEQTKAFIHSDMLHHFKVYGIIDRDYRTEEELQKYEENNIYSLRVAEIENLFLTEEIIQFMADYLGLDSKNIFKQIQDEILQRLTDQISKQINQSITARIKYLLEIKDISGKTEDEIKKHIAEIPQNINYDSIKEEKTKKFNDALDSKDYNQILKIFNDKSLSKSIGHFYNIDNKCYIRMVIQILEKDRDQVYSILKKYLPNIPSE